MVDHHQPIFIPPWESLAVILRNQDEPFHWGTGLIFLHMHPSLRCCVLGLAPLHTLSLSCFGYKRGTCLYNVSHLSHPIPKYFYFIRAYPPPEALMKVDHGSISTLYPSGPGASYHPLQIHTARVTPYKTAANGQVERYNRTLMDAVSCYINDSKD